MENEGNEKSGTKGRPTEYKEEFVEQARKLCEIGATDCEIAEFFDVDVRTIYRWKHSYPSFCQAIKSGKEICDERVERSLYQKATGFRYTEQQAIKVREGQYEEKVEVVDVEREALPDTPAAIFWLKNRRGWRDKVDTTIGNPDGSNLTIQILRLSDAPKADT